MKIRLERHPENPIVQPGGPAWRRATVYNPGAILEGNTFYLMERTSGSLHPHITYFALMKSADGVHFTHVVDKPVFTAQQLGYELGSVEDPRITKTDGRYYMTYALQINSWWAFPSGWGLPRGMRMDVPGVITSGPRPENMTRSGIAVSDDLIRWEHVTYTSEVGLDDRDHILFPDRIGGKFVLLRRPQAWVGAAHGTDAPGIWMTVSDDLKTWSNPRLLISPKFSWESAKIGGSTPPIRTARGWLVLYHGVQNVEPDLPVYRTGAMLLDLEDPSKVLARTCEPILEPETYYERRGLIIPNTVFPCGNVVKDGVLYVYYGCCDTAISLATIPVEKLVDAMLS